MDQATEAAEALVCEFSSDEMMADRIRICLSEIPIGDEYGLLEDDDWTLFQKFESFAEERGIQIWQPVRLRPTSRHDAIVHARCRTSDWPHRQLVVKQGDDGGFTAEYLPKQP